MKANELSQQSKKKLLKDIIDIFIQQIILEKPKSDLKHVRGV